jgi:hypothetical protein
LTNYAVNKSHENFEFNEDASNVGVGNKRTIQWFLEWLDTPEQLNPTSEKGRVSPGSAHVWTSVADVVNRTLLAVQPQLSHAYRTCIPDPDDDGFSCFEILGFDIMFRNNYEPILVEVNHSPSLTCDTPLDKNIKYGLLTETMRLVKVSGTDRKKEAQRTALGAQSRLYSGFKDADEKLLTAERDMMLREKGWNVRMNKRKTYENKVSTRFNLIHPTEEAVALCTRHEMACIDAQKNNGEAKRGKEDGEMWLLQGHNNTDPTTAGASVAPVVPVAPVAPVTSSTSTSPLYIDPRRLKTLARPYGLFYKEASRMFSESTLGISPSNRRERQLLSSAQPRPLDYSQSYQDFVHKDNKNNKKHNTATNNVMPVVSGTQYSNEQQASMHREYRGERENNNRKRTNAHSRHLPQTLGASLQRVLNNAPSSTMDLHRNSVLHQHSNRTNDPVGRTAMNFQKYMETVNRTRDIEQEYRQMINNQMSRVDTNRTAMEERIRQDRIGTTVGNHPVDKRSGVLLTKNQYSTHHRSSTPPMNPRNVHVRRGLPSMERVHVQRPSSMGSTGYGYGGTRPSHGGPIGTARALVKHHDSRVVTIVPNRSQQNTQYFVQPKYQKTTRKAHKKLRLIGVNQSLGGGNGGDSGVTVFQQQQKKRLKKKAKKKKPKKKVANGNTGKKKVTVKHLFSKTRRVVH